MKFDQPAPAGAGSQYESVEAPEGYMFALTPEKGQIHIVRDDGEPNAYSLCLIKPANGWRVYSRTRVSNSKPCGKCRKTMWSELRYGAK